jgi:hypothetical protein
LVAAFIPALSLAAQRRHHAACHGRRCALNGRRNAFQSAAPAPCRASTMLKKLPIGIQTFREIIEAGHVHIDKTAHARALAQSGKYCFLSRARRFGKSLFLDTL